MRIRRWLPSVVLAIALLGFAGGALAQGSIGSVVFDLDSTAGDQGLRERDSVTADQTVSLQIYGTELSSVTGYGLKIKFDAASLSFVDFVGVTGNLNLPLAGVTPPPTADTVEVASIGAPLSGGVVLLGTVRFRTSASFGPSSTAAMLAVSLSVVTTQAPGGEDQAHAVFSGAYATVTGAPPPLPPAALTLAKVPATDPMPASGSGQGGIADGSTGEVYFEATATRGGIPSVEVLTWTVKNTGTGPLMILIPEPVRTVAPLDSVVLETTTGAADGKAWLVIDTESTTSAMLTVVKDGISAGWDPRWEVPVSVGFVSFDGRIQADGSVALEWLVASQTNNFGWEVYRRSLGGSFENVGTIRGAGTSNEALVYRFVDHSVPASMGSVSYFLTQIGLDGERSVIEPITVFGSTAVEDEESRAIPSRFSVGQNRPNPFNPMTTIEYVLAEDAAVKIGIYDMAGALVVRIADGVVRSAGRHSVQWDGRDSSGRDVASGTYIYRIAAGERLAVRKMLLVR